MLSCLAAKGWSKAYVPVLRSEIGNSGGKDRDELKPS